jgi:hypothetical protein
MDDTIEKETVMDSVEKAVNQSASEDSGQALQSDQIEQQPQDHAASKLFQLPPSNLFPLSPIRYVFTCEFGAKKEYKLHLSEENVVTFHELVQKTGLNLCSPTHISNILHKHSKVGAGIYQGISVIYRPDLPNVVRDLVPITASSCFTQDEMERFSTYFTIFFLSFARNANDTNLHSGVEQVIVKELAVGFSFFCAGSKSQKLDETFKILSENGSDVLTKHKLLRFIRSYLRMILGISLLSSSPHVNLHHVNALLGTNPFSVHVSNLCYTTEIGSSWITNDFLNSLNAKNAFSKSGTDKVSFQDFAVWYQSGGFNKAPWFELLDLSKLKGLVQDSSSSMKRPITINVNHAIDSDIKPLDSIDHVLSPTMQPLNPPTSTGKIRSFDEFIDESCSPNPKKKLHKSSHSPARFNPEVKDILSTFPLSDGRSLIVLREDAAYVRSVVEQFGLLNVSPESVWSKLFSHSKS